MKHIDSLGAVAACVTHFCMKPNSFLYEDKVLCWISESRLRILDSKHRVTARADPSTSAELLVHLIAVESLGPVESPRQFLVDLGRRITTRLGDDREGNFLFNAFQFYFTVLIQFCCMTI